ncbi:hypothetical protein E2C01_005969 [Portunus trituberculatus]|uniref:Uncharacterized protein n=1 Tax=Portunus trituberculatus TaxID=210409 RepID=A0A5B7D0J0_PORTR|nr:hypothetical protein [Portunus trituberculatus]
MADKPFSQVEDISFNYADLLRRLTLSGEELRTQSSLAAALQELPADPNPPPRYSSSSSSST